MMYSAVLNEFDWRLANEWYFEEISHFEDDGLLGIAITVKILADKTRVTSVLLVHYLEGNVLLKNEYELKGHAIICVETELMALGMFNILGSQLFFHPDLVQKRLLSRILKTMA